MLARCHLTFFEHAYFEALGEATRLTCLPAALGDLTFIRGGTTVLNIACWMEMKTVNKSSKQCFLTQLCFCSEKQPALNKKKNL